MNFDLLARILLECFLLLEWNNAISTNHGDGFQKINSNDYKDRGVLDSETIRLDSEGCITSADCAFNGECDKDHDDEEEERHATKNHFDPEAPGVCHCFAGWKGETCEVLDVTPVDPRKVGLVLPNHDSSTWGGSVVYCEEDGLYHMFASEILYDCGLYSWTTNSQVIRAVSKSPYGPYEKAQVILPTFAHDANIIRAPTGEFALYVTALEGVNPMDCRNQTQSFGASSIEKSRYLRSSPGERNSKIDNIGANDNDDDDVPPKDTYMLWSPTPEGPWSEPVMVLNSTIYNSDYWKKYNKTAKCDSNLNGIILPSDADGKQSFLGLWRRCETDELLTIPHVMVASDWKNASTYQPILSPLFVLAGSGAEDPSNIWTTKTSDMKPGQVAYHAIFHDEQATRCMLGACGGQGRHAVSLDGKAWKYASVNAYERHFSCKASASGIIRSDTRARPHIVLAPTKQGDDPWHQTPIALSTGLKETDESGYVYTLVQPLRSSDEQPTFWTTVKIQN